MQMSGNTILITGGGSGIGRALAQRFHDQGNTVIITGRREAMLREAAEGRANLHTYVLDVDDPATLADFVAKVRRDHPTLNVLVNNAGILPTEDLFNSDDLAKAEQTVVTNLLGPIRLVYGLIPHLSRQAGAAIVNVSSGLAFVPMVAAPTYSATKAALHSLSVSWRKQLEGRIEVIELPPPGVRTELTPGQSEVEAYMPLDAFIDEVMNLFNQVPTPREIAVGDVMPLRNAEREGRFDQMVDAINAH